MARAAQLSCSCQCLLCWHWLAFRSWLRPTRATIEYDPSLPSDGGAKQNENIAKSSESPKTGGAEAPPSTGAGEGYAEQAPPSSEGQGSNANTGTGGGTSQGSPDKGNNPPW